MRTLKMIDLEIGYDIPRISLSWDNAIRACSEIPGDGWRLPTANEFRLIRSFRSLGIAGIIIRGNCGEYWSNTKVAKSRAYYYDDGRLVSREGDCSLFKLLLPVRNI